MILSMMSVVIFLSASLKQFDHFFGIQVLLILPQNCISAFCMHFGDYADNLCWADCGSSEVLLGIKRF